MYQDFRDKNQVFSGHVLPLPRHLQRELRGPHRAGRAAKSFPEITFPVLGVGAAMGRVFNASDDLIAGRPSPGRSELRLLENALRRRPRHILGRKIVVNGYPLDHYRRQPGRVRRRRSQAIRRRSAFPSPCTTTLPQDTVPGAEQPAPPIRARFSARLKPGITMENAKAGLQPLFHQILQMEVSRSPHSPRPPTYIKQQFLTMWMDALPGSPKAAPTCAISFRNRCWR